MEITFRYTRDFSVLFMVTDNKKQSYVVLMKKFVRETQLLEYIQIWLELRKREKTMIDMWAENNRADVCGRETIFFHADYRNTGFLCLVCTTTIYFSFRAFFKAARVRSLARVLSASPYATPYPMTTSLIVIMQVSERVSSQYLRYAHTRTIRSCIV